MEPLLRAAEASDASDISELVQSGFNEFVAPDWQAGAREVFMLESSAERFEALIPDATFAAVAESEGKLVGFILLTRPALLSFLFVHARWHRHGIAKTLWNSARMHLESEHPTVKTVELNSSPFAVGAYRALGFYPISEPFRRGGAVATRMACWLPGRALSEAANAG